METPTPPAAVLGDARGRLPSGPTAWVEIEIGDATGIVVVDRLPVGPAPQRIAVPVTERGYLARPVIVSVRFVARNVEEASMTINEVLEVTDRPPDRLVFTRDGVRRQFGQVAAPVTMR